MPALWVTLCSGPQRWATVENVPLEPKVTGSCGINRKTTRQGNVETGRFWFHIFPIYSPGSNQRGKTDTKSRVKVPETQKGNHRLQAARGAGAQRPRGFLGPTRSRWPALAAAWLSRTRRHRSAGRRPSSKRISDDV